MQHTNLQLQLNQILSLIQHGQLSQAEGDLHPLKAQFPSVYQVWFLSGVLAKKQNRYEQALADFVKASHCQRVDWQLYNHLAICCKHLSRYTQAEQHYRQAITLAGAQQHEPLQNLLLLLIDTQNYSQAQQLAKEYPLIINTQPVLQKLLADVYRHIGQYQKAQALYQRVLAHQPDYANAHHNLGLCYQHQGQVEQAISCFEQARKRLPGNYQPLSCLGDCYVSLDDLPKAEQYYLAALACAPQQCEVHYSLNELYWQQGNHQRFGQSYEQALSAFPDDAVLRSACGDLFASARQYERALTVLEQAPDQQARPILVCRAYLLAKIDQLPLALTLANQALATEFDLQLALHKVQLEITLLDFDLAQRSLKQVHELAPHNQLAIALQATLWRQQGDKRYNWLNDYPNLVKAYTLPVPEGYACLPSFLLQLKKRLLTLHQFNTAPLQQTLINGSQIPGGLFARQYPEISALVRVTRQVVDKYIAAMADDPEHPLLSRKNAAYEFAGSWSVKLNSQGYHVSHVHPQGWISSSFYVHIPTDMGDEADAGAIYFGKSPFNLPEKDDAQLTLRPKAGMLVLFPSYMWHGTLPFTVAQADEFRLTSPFDVVPNGGS